MAVAPALAKAVQTSGKHPGTMPLTVRQHDANEAAATLHGPKTQSLNAPHDTQFP